MSKELQKMLQELKNRGDTVLRDEVSAFLEATQEPSIAFPYSRRLLAHAAKTLRDGTTRDDVALAHDFLGASVEVFKEELAGGMPTIPHVVCANLGKDLAPEFAFKCVEKAPVGDADFDTASEGLVTTLANVLLDAGYVKEARKYLTEFNLSNERDIDVVRSTKKALTELQAKYRKNGEFIRARALEEVISDLDNADGDDFSDYEDEAKSESESEKLEMDSEANTDDECTDDVCDKEAQAKPELVVDPPSEEEVEEKYEAKAALSAGNIRLAKRHLAKAARLERRRLTAALIDAGDMELALAGLEEEESVEKEDKSGGYPQPDDFAGESTLPSIDEDTDEESTHVADEKPTEEEMQKREELAEEEDTDEREVAKAITAHIRSSVRKGKLRAAKEGLKDLNSLEKEIVAGVKTAETKLKNYSLAKEGYALWKDIRAMNLKAIKLVAEVEGDQETVKKAADGLESLQEGEMEDKPIENLDDSLDTVPQSSEEKEVSDEVKVVNDQEQMARKEDEEKAKESDAMQYECLQSMDDIKDLEVDRSALAFTFWDSKEDPYWTIQASGKPVAEVHLNDQTDPEDVAAFFCDQVKWPNVIAQTTEKVGLYNMLKGVKARFYAHGITKSALAKSLKSEVEASLTNVRAERLSTLRADFIDAMVCAAESLNKGLISGKSNPLKRAFVDKLTSLGFSNAAVAVEDCFGSSFRPFLDQVLADAQEYLEMPKEAFAHTKKMINTANNVAMAQAAQFSNESLSDRLSRRSMPLAAASESYMAPSEVDATLQQMSASEKQNEMKRRLRLGFKM